MKKVEEQNQNIDLQSQTEKEMNVEEQNIEDKGIEQQDIEQQDIEEQNMECEAQKETKNEQVEEKKKRKSEKSDKDDKEKIAVLEAILFAMGDSVEVSRLAQVIEETPRKTKNLLLELQKKYKRDKRGIDIIEL